MIAIVTDSTANLTKQEALDWGVSVVPISYTVSGQTYYESYSDQNGDYENLLSQNSGSYSTSQPAVASYMSVFKELVNNGYDVLCLVISSRLSGVYSGASIAAREVSASKIIVVDSLTTAGGLALLLKYTKERIKENISLKELATEIENKRNDVGIVFSVGNIEALRKSGRLGIALQSGGMMLNIRPILMCEDGVVVSRGVSRGKGQQIKAMIRYIPEEATDLIVQYLGYNINHESLVLAINEKFPQINVTVRRIGPSLGIHLGVDVMGVAWIVN